MLTNCPRSVPRNKMVLNNRNNISKKTREKIRIEPRESSSLETNGGYVLIYFYCIHNYPYMYRFVRYYTKQTEFSIISISDLNIFLIYFVYRFSIQHVLHFHAHVHTCKRKSAHAYMYAPKRTHHNEGQERIMCTIHIMWWAWAVCKSCRTDMFHFLFYFVLFEFSIWASLYCYHYYMIMAMMIACLSRDELPFSFEYIRNNGMYNRVHLLSLALSLSLFRSSIVLLAPIITQTVISTRNWLASEEH